MPKVHFWLIPGESDFEFSLLIEHLRANNDHNKKNQPDCKPSALHLQYALINSEIFFISSEIFFIGSETPVSSVLFVDLYW